MTKSSNPYLSKDEIPRTRKSVVAFIDILGFKELILGPGADNALIKVKQAISESSKRLNKTYSSMNNCDAWVVKIFSDNVAIGFPVITRFRKESGVHLF